MIHRISCCYSSPLAHLHISSFRSTLHFYSRICRRQRRCCISECATEFDGSFSPSRSRRDETSTTHFYEYYLLITTTTAIARVCIFNVFVRASFAISRCHRDAPRGAFGFYPEIVETIFMLGWHHVARYTVIRRLSIYMTLRIVI